MKTVASEEGRTFDRGLEGIVVSELGEGQKLRPIVLLIVTINAKILLDRLIHPFCLTVGLGMKSSRETTFDTE